MKNHICDSLQFYPIPLNHEKGTRLKYVALNPKAVKQIIKSHENKIGVTLHLNSQESECDESDSRKEY